MEVASIVLAALAFLFSCYTFFVHDRRLKKQEKILNAYQLRSFVQEEKESKCAVIRTKAIKPKAGQRVLVVSNFGKAMAKHLKIEMLDNEQVIATRPEMPVTYAELLPGASREIILMLSSGDDELTLEYQWEDSFSADNQEKQTTDL